MNVVEFDYPEEIAAFEPEFIEAQKAAYMETAIEDDEIGERMDAGRRALMERGDNEVGPYQSPMEDGMQHFHEVVSPDNGPPPAATLSFFATLLQAANARPVGRWQLFFDRHRTAGRLHNTTSQGRAHASAMDGGGGVSVCHHGGLHQVRGACILNTAEIRFLTSGLIRHAGACGCSAPPRASP